MPKFWKEQMKQIYEQLIELSTYCLAFANVDRATSNVDGITPESDTDHTVMLSMVGCAFASVFMPNLDLGKVAQFALVHDFTEVLTGDVDTLKPFDKQAKIEREKKALESLKSTFESIPWLGHTLEEYESLASPEARFVKVLDKVLPKITQILSNGKTLTKRGLDSSALKKFMDSQLEDISNSYGFDQKETLKFAQYVSDQLLNMLIAKENLTDS